MKYLLFYYAVAAIYTGSTSSLTCAPAWNCVSSIGPEQGHWTAELKNSKTECMEELKKHSDPTHAWCIPVNGYTNELTPY